MARRDLRPIVSVVLEAYHAVNVDGVAHFFSGGAWHSGDRELNGLVARLDPRSNRTDRAEVRDLVSLLAPEIGPAPANFIAFANGVLNVDTMDFSAAAPDLLVPNRIPWDWEPGARSDEVEEYLDSTAAGDASARSRIEEMLGACLFRGRLPYLFVLVGMAPVPDGDASNGKSTLVELAFRLVGEENRCALDIHLFGKRFMAGNIAGKLVVGSPDSPSDRPDASALSVLKSVATGDVISSDVKNGPLVTFRPHATVVMAANKVPPFLVDAGLRRRTVVVPLRGKFAKGGSDPLGLICTDEHMPALLVHAVEGLERLRASGPAPCASADSAFGGLVALSSTIEQWVDDDEVDPAKLNGEPCTSTYQRYAAWCSLANEKPLTRGEFDREPANRWPGLAAKRCRHAGQATTKRWTYIATP